MPRMSFMLAMEYKEEPVMNKRPHIIIFNPDEMRTDAMGHMGNAATSTPYLDLFAKNEAVSFRHAACQNPVCVPSRCSFFTGQYPHVNGHRTMAHLLRPGESSLFSELKQNGYYVWMNARNDLYAAQYEGWVEENANEIFYGGQAPRAPMPENENVRGEQSGKNYYSHFEGRLGVDENGRNYSRDDEAVDACIQRLTHPVDYRPMCAFVGLMFPHTPYAVEEPYYSKIDRSKLPPRVRHEDCDGKPLMEQRLRELQHMQGYTERDWDELRAVYLAMCSKVDVQFARLCEALKTAGIYDDCAIFFLSDHGDFAGDYGLPEKAQNCFEDCLVNVPLLIKPPKGEPIDAGVSDSLVELVDFYATAMQYAKVTPSHTHFGKSLAPLLANRKATLRQYVFCEGGRMPHEKHCDESHINGKNGSPPSFVYWPRQTAQRDDKAHQKGTMIRSLEYKYISRLDGSDEFYDLTLDPQEKHNVINCKKYEAQILKMQREQLRWYQATCDIVPLDFDARFNNEMLWAMLRGNVENENEARLIKRLVFEGNKMPFIMEALRKQRQQKE